jgi:DNA-binding NarL/FixJ family response regulator
MAEVVVADYAGVHLSASVRDLSGRVVILTHSDSEAKIRYALTQGVRGYLLSGCGSEELIAAVRSVHEGGVAVAPQVARRIAESLRHEALTTKEARVLRQMMLGRSNKRIASEYGVSEGTIKSHVKAILNKLNADNRTEAVAIARRRGILPEEGEGLVAPPTRTVAELGSSVGAYTTPRNAFPSQR